MSTINTNGLDVNYPVPGVNNNSQGFRNNFTNIKQNLDIAANEISDLETSVVVKNALGDAAIDNNMANVLIANASVLGFRSTMYNLGGDLSGGILIDLGIADVHTGTLGGNVLFSFGNWAPTGTLSKVTLMISTSNTAANYSMQFPSEVIFSSDDYGTTLLNNYANVGNLATLTFPYNCTQLILECYSVDCGNAIYITPVNRPYQSTQIVQRTPPSTGQYGDMEGTVCVSPEVTQLYATSSTASDFFVTANTVTLYSGMPVVFTGTSFEANVTVGTTYYVGNIANTTHFTVSANANISGNVNLAGSSGNMKVNPVTYLYVAKDDFAATVFNRSITSITAPNIITVSGSTANLVANMPIMFTGDGTGNTGNITINQAYYVSSVAGSNITISQNRFNGIAGAEVNTLTTVGTGNVDIDYTIYEGTDIFARIPLQPF